jgi:hypothetical protein
VGGGYVSWDSDHPIKFCVAIPNKCLFQTFYVAFCIGVQRGVSKRVEDGRRPPALQVGRPWNSCKADSGVAHPQVVEGSGMVGPSDTLVSCPWIFVQFNIQKTIRIRNNDWIKNLMKVGFCVTLFYERSSLLMYGKHDISTKILKKSNQLTKIQKWLQPRVLGSPGRCLKWFLHMELSLTIQEKWFIV